MTTNKIRKILCPIDLSETSAGTLRAATALARCWQADTMILHAYQFQPPPYFTEVQLERLALQWDDVREVAKKSLQDFVRTTLGNFSPPMKTRW